MRRRTILWIDKVKMMTQKIRKAVFPVGGNGTRFLPATKAMPKEMLPVVDKPLIQYAVEEAQAAGIEEFIFVTGRGKSAIEDHFDFSPELENILRDRVDIDLSICSSAFFDPGQIAYTRQQAPLGLGHAVWCARDLVGDEPFAILLADDLVMAEVPCLQQMVAAFERTGGNIISVIEVPRDQTDRYGILETGNEDGELVEVRGLVEKPNAADAPSTLSIIGRYILLPEIFNLLGALEAGVGGEIQLTDSMSQMVGKYPFHGLRFDGTRFDCGDKAGYQEANIAYALQREDLRDSMLTILKKYSKSTRHVSHR
jgi:UTP--glucose-1-phosphate uridylyltransferase